MNKFENCQKIKKGKLTFCPICLKETAYLYCSEKCKEKANKQKITPSGFVLNCEGVISHCGICKGK